jgi:antibiotic biosynthesis monooxygenase (ABM) superfamily enzyme
MPERSAEFEKMFAESYVPAMRKQQGYQRSTLLRLYATDVANEIMAAPTEFNYQMELVFDTEENRQKWVASAEHTKAWPEASGMARKFAWRGFDLVGTDQA